MVMPNSGGSISKSIKPCCSLPKRRETKDRKQVLQPQFQNSRDADSNGNNITFPVFCCPLSQLVCQCSFPLRGTNVLSFCMNVNPVTDWWVMISAPHPVSAGVCSTMSFNSFFPPLGRCSGYKYGINVFCPPEHSYHHLLPVPYLQCHIFIFGTFLHKPSIY